MGVLLRYWRGQWRRRRGGLGADAGAYRSLLGPVVRDWPALAPELLGPLHFPRDPLMLARFGLKGLPSVTWLARRFRTREARALIGGDGSAWDATVDELVDGGHHVGLPGVGSYDGVADTAAGVDGDRGCAGGLFLFALGGRIETGVYVRSMSQLPSSRCVLLDMTPRQVLQLGGHRWSSLYRWQLERYRYGMGVFKIDWALAEPIPWLAEGCRRAGTVHIGGDF